MGVRPVAGGLEELHQIHRPDVHASLLDRTARDSDSPVEGGTIPREALSQCEVPPPPGRTGAYLWNQAKVEIPSCLLAVEVK